jgi:hypothetical protein
MPTNLGKFIAKDDVVHFHFEAALISSCCCDILCVLTSCANHMEFLVLLAIEEWADCR